MCARRTSSTSAAPSRARSRAYSYVVNDAKGAFVANAALASRKDARDAVTAARKAFGGWSARTAYNRAQVLYRVAEVLEDRRPQFVDAVRQSEGLNAARAERVVDEAIDRLVWYAGWADKITQVTGNANPVAGPFFNLSTPEPTGVVAVLAPQRVVAARSRQRGRAGDRHRQHRRRRVVVRPAAAGGEPRRGARDLRRARRRGQHPDRLRRDHRARGWPRTWTSTRSSSSGVAGDPQLARWPRRWRWPRPRTSSACVAPRPPSPTGPATRASTR